MSFERRAIRLNPEQYLGQKTYFVTICCHDREPFFVDLGLGRWLLTHVCDSASRQFMLLHAFCIMPDHLHLLLEGQETSSDLLRFVKDLKQRTAYEYKQRVHRPLWQYNFYDHILRPTERAISVAWYIWLNPIRKGICRKPGDYPLSGSLTLPWPQDNLPEELWVPYWKKP